MEHPQEEAVRILAGPCSQRAQAFSRALGMHADFIEWTDGSPDSLLITLNQRLSYLENEIRQDLLDECQQVLNTLPPLEVFVFDDEDAPRLKMLDIVQSLFVPVYPQSGTVKGPYIHIARKVIVQDHKTIDAVLEACNGWCSQIPPRGLVILTDCFAFPPTVNDRPLEVLTNNPKLVKLSAYSPSIIPNYTPALKIHDALIKQGVSSVFHPLVLPVSRIWDQPEVRIIEEKLGLPILPKMMFALDPCLNEGFERTLLYILTMYDSYLRSCIIRPSIISRQILTEAITLSTHLLRGCIHSHPLLMEDFINKSWHSLSRRISSIQEDLRQLSLPRDGQNKILSKLIDFKGIMRQVADEVLIAFHSGDETSIINVADVVRDVAARVEHTHSLCGKSTKCDFDFCSNDIAVRTNRTLLHNIMEPILDNAFDAVEVVTSRPNWSPKVQCRLRVEPILRRLNSVTIEIEDNGIGIPKENLHRIYDDNFSTKGDGHGRGLNKLFKDKLRHLDIVCNVYSEPNQGTRFELILPQEEGK